MSDTTRYDLWVVEVSDPVSAMEALSDALGDRVRAREAVLSVPAMLLHGADTEEVQALSTRLSGCGLTLESRPSRRAVVRADDSGDTVPSASGPAASAAAPPSSGAPPAGPLVLPSGAASAPGRPVSTAPSPGAPQARTDAAAPSARSAAGAPVPASAAGDAGLGVAKTSYYAALVAAPAYVLQPSVAVAIAVLSVLSVGASLSALSGSISLTLASPLIVFALRFGVFAQVVRRSHEGQTDLRLEEDDDLSDLLFAGVRIVLVNVLAFGPFIAASWFLAPGMAASVVPGTGVGAATGVMSALLILATLLVPLVALPGAYAATALGEGCGGLNPLVGLVVARRVPGAYFTTLLYLAAFWFASVALITGAGLGVAARVIASVGALGSGAEPSVAGTIASMTLVIGLSTVLDVTCMVISARILGLLTYHYSEELGL